MINTSTYDSWDNNFWRKADFSYLKNPYYYEYKDIKWIIDYLTNPDKASVTELAEHLKNAWVDMSVIPTEAILPYHIQQLRSFLKQYTKKHTLIWFDDEHVAQWAIVQFIEKLQSFVAWLFEDEILCYQEYQADSAKQIEDVFMYEYDEKLLLHNLMKTLGTYSHLPFSESFSQWLVSVKEALYNHPPLQNNFYKVLHSYYPLLSEFTVGEQLWIISNILMTMLVLIPELKSKLFSAYTLITYLQKESIYQKISRIIQHEYEKLYQVH